MTDRHFDPYNEIQWLYKATRFTFPRKAPNMCRTGEDYPVHIEACEQRDGTVLWAVRQLGNCLRLDRLWELECTPSSRDEQWKEMHRFGSKEQAYQALTEAIREEQA